MCSDRSALLCVPGATGGKVQKRAAPSPGTVPSPDTVPTRIGSASQGGFQIGSTAQKKPTESVLGFLGLTVPVNLAGAPTSAPTSVQGGTSTTRARATAAASATAPPRVTRASGLVLLSIDKRLELANAARVSGCRLLASAKSMSNGTQAQAEAVQAASGIFGDFNESDLETARRQSAAGVGSKGEGRALVLVVQTSRCLHVASASCTPTVESTPVSSVLVACDLF